MGQLSHYYYSYKINTKTDVYISNAEVFIKNSVRSPPSRLLYLVPATDPSIDSSCVNKTEAELSTLGQTYTHSHINSTFCKVESH